ncbi:MAG: thiamine ABC transporter ATP-binding protein [Pseudomonadota bacterium]|nr:thiamine ABC transporter ATP-binding protein [Pseudomonadota bacterium]
MNAFLLLDGVALELDGMAMHFDLEVGKGEFVAIMGPSGAGKSTLLDLVAGFLTPTTGTIRIDGQDMNGRPPRGRPLSILFQDNNLFAHLDVESNVALGISPARKLDQVQYNSLKVALARVGLTGLEHRQPAELSGGERQRVGLARCLVRRRPLLLLDEPFAALGPALRREMLLLVKSLHQEHNLTVLLVTHTPGDAKLAADHAAFLDGGRVIAKRPTKKLFSSRDIPGLAAYLGK